MSTIRALLSEPSVNDDNDAYGDTSSSSSGNGNGIVRIPVRLAALRVISTLSECRNVEFLVNSFCTDDLSYMVHKAAQTLVHQRKDGTFVGASRNHWQEDLVPLAGLRRAQAGLRAGSWGEAATGLLDAGLAAMPGTAQNAAERLRKEMDTNTLLEEIMYACTALANICERSANYCYMAYQDGVLMEVRVAICLRRIRQSPYITLS